MMSDREQITRGAEALRARGIASLIHVYGDGPHDRRPARSPALGIAVMHADVSGGQADILSACEEGVRLESAEY